MAVCVSAAVIQNSAAINDAQDLEGAESANPQFFGGGFGGGYGGYGGGYGGYGGYGKICTLFLRALDSMWILDDLIKYIPANTAMFKREWNSVYRST